MMAAPAPAFRWRHADVYGLARRNCTMCAGGGFRIGSAGPIEGSPCKCVLREIFRACHAQFRYCATHAGLVTHVSFHGDCPSVQRGWRAKDADYQIDFVNLCKRALGVDSIEYKIFRFHFLLGADWKLCCRKLGIDRGTFFHAVYRVEEKCGRAFRETQPYALYPIDEYYSPPTRGTAVRAMPSAAEPRAFTPLRPPLAPKPRIRLNAPKADTVRVKTLVKRPSARAAHVAVAPLPQAHMRQTLGLPPAP